MDFTSIPDIPGDLDLLTDNACWPKMLGTAVDPGFALATDDPWNWVHQNDMFKYLARPDYSVTGKS